MSDDAFVHARWHTALEDPGREPAGPIRDHIEQHDRAVAAQVAGMFRVAAELVVQDVRAQRGDHIASLVEDSFAAHFDRAEQIGGAS